MQTQAVVTNEVDAVAAEPRIVWSRSVEDFFGSFDSLGELIGDDPEAFKVGQTVYFGEIREHGTNWVDAAAVCELIEDRAYDVAGEGADGFPFVGTEAANDLDAFLREWQAAHCKPTFYDVVNVDEYTITADDIARVGGAA